MCWRSGPCAGSGSGGRPSRAGASSPSIWARYACCLALVSPLDALADNWLFSAHMAQHMLLTFVAPPLWLVGLPEWLVRQLVPQRWLAAVTQPVTAFMIFNGVMWAWHVPAAYDAALRYPALHILEHLTLHWARPSSAGGRCWGRGPPARMPPPLRMAYLIPSLFACTALAGLITLSSVQLYSFYGQAAWQWGLAPLADQQIGGLIMWLPGDMLYLVLIVWTVNALLEAPERGLQGVQL